MKMSPMALKIYQSGFKILPKTKITLKILHYTSKILPKWRNIAKSGHTASNVYIGLNLHLSKWVDHMRI